jgi:hypothetical protein
MCEVEERAMKAIMTGVALAALIAAAPAGAQTEPQPAQPQEMYDTATCPEGATTTPEGEPCPAAPSAIAPDEPSDDAAATLPAEEAPDATGSLPADTGTDAAQTDEMQPESTDMVAEEGGKFIGEQEDTAFLASELIGQTVYNSADEALGDVNDILWKDDGTIDAIVVGVGGFLGIGEKAVAVAYDAVEVTTDENGDKKLLFDATSDELAAAPEFTTSAEKLAALQAEQAPAPAPTGGMTPAPATPPAQ